MERGNPMPHLDFREIKREISMFRVLDWIGWRARVIVRDAIRRGACPIHGSRNPRSRNFCATEGGYYCHSCHAHGDQIRFWAELRHLTMYHAAIDLCEVFEVPMPWKPR